MTANRTYPPGIENFDDLLDRILRGTDATVKTRRGDEIVLSPCPVGDCKGDKFSINSTKGAWNCPKCGERGNAWQLVERLGIAPVAPARSTRSHSSTKSVKAKRLTQEVVTRTYEQYRNDLEHNPAVQAEIKARGLTMDTARAWGLGAKGNAVVFPYSRSTGQVGFVKFKDVTTGDQWRWPTKDEMPSPAVEPLFARRDFNPFEPVSITEGEWDTIALWQSGFQNTGSISGGASTWHDEWTTQLAPCPEVFLAYDRDEPGEKGFAKALERLGREVVRRLTFAPYKDACDALRAGWTGVDFDRAYATAPRKPPAILMSLSELAHDRVAKAKTGVCAEPISTGHPEFDRTQRGLRPGELTVVTADTGEGKTTFTLDLTLRLAERGESVLYLSMEQSPESTVDQILGMLAHRPFEDMKAGELDQALDAVPPLFFLGMEPERNRFEQVQQAIRYAHSVHGVRYVVVDHLDYLIETQRGETRYQAASEAVRAVQTAARDHDLHLVLICQPTTDSGRNRSTNAPAIRLADIAETRLARQLASNGWVWTSDKAKQTGRLFVAKARHGPAKDGITLEFRFDGFRFIETGIRAGSSVRA